MAPAPVVRTVKLAVRPARASVEVDGVHAESKNGVIEIAGTIGSVHEVRAKGSDKVQRVVITEGGAVPQSIDLGSQPTAPMSGGAPPHPSTIPASSTKPVAPALTIDKSFEK
jgi:hypothetical protein